MLDAEKIGPILHLFAPNDAGVINTAGNRDMIARFVHDVVPAAERGGMMTKDGYLSRSGLDRLESAIFAAAYGDPDLVVRLTETIDPDAKNITNAMLNTASHALAVKYGIWNGDLHDFDFTDNVVEAANLFYRMKRKNETAEEYFGMAKLFEQESAEARAIAYFFDTHRRSAKSISLFLNKLYDTVEDMGDPREGSLFEEVTNEITTADIIENARRRYENETGEVLSIPEIQRGEREIPAKAGRSTKQKAGRGKEKRVKSIDLHILPGGDEDTAPGIESTMPTSLAAEPAWKEPPANWNEITDEESAAYTEEELGILLADIDRLKDASLIRDGEDMVVREGGESQAIDEGSPLEIDVVKTML